MHEVYLHKDARKALKKAQNKIKKKALLCINHLMVRGLDEFPFPIGILQGEFRKFRYLEAKIDNDYRIIFRTEGAKFYVRYAGTHNSLGTG
jgi:mRNA-degrading endonuclease YafQ of YafQ-DinJ toxin-antitoxin module